MEIRGDFWWIIHSYPLNRLEMNSIEVAVIFNIRI